jgi:hypothetical protein
MANIKTQDILKYVQAVAYVVSSTLITYNLFSVKVDKSGYFWVSKNELWLAIGVGILAIGLVIRNWKKL